MAYKFALVDGSFLIRVKDQDEAVCILLDFLATKTLLSPVERSMLETTVIGGLGAVLLKYGYVPHYDSSSGDLVKVDKEDQLLSVESEKELFTVLAPLVGGGSYLQYQGEDGARWRWVFSDGKLQEIPLRRGFAR